MTYIYSENCRDWEKLAKFELPVYRTGFNKAEFNAYSSAKAKARAACPFCQKVLSYCSMPGHVGHYHSDPNAKKSVRKDKLPLEEKHKRRTEYGIKYREENRETIREKK